MQNVNQKKHASERGQIRTVVSRSPQLCKEFHIMFLWQPRISDGYRINPEAHLNSSAPATFLKA
jgi:hypothetical protein